jgi:sec-independent protein translocase protein TatA
MFTAIAGKMGVTELLVILIIVLVIFGPKQLPKLSKMFGKTVTSFKQGMEEGLSDDDEKSETKETKAEVEKKDESSSESN